MGSITICLPVSQIVSATPTLHSGKFQLLCQAQVEGNQRYGRESEDGLPLQRICPTQ